jgi:ribosomal protein L31
VRELTEEINSRSRLSGRRPIREQNARITFPAEIDVTSDIHPIVTQNRHSQPQETGRLDKFKEQVRLVPVSCHKMPFF